MNRDRSGQRAPFTVRVLAGRLLGTRAGNMHLRSDWADFRRQIHLIVRDSATPLVACTDLRGIHELPEEVHGLLVSGMRELNPWIDRSAILLPSTTLGLTVDRLLRAARSEARQTFRHSADVKAWLSSCLSPVERLHLDAFLGGTGGP